MEDMSIIHVSLKYREFSGPNRSHYTSRKPPSLLGGKRLSLMALKPEHIVLLGRHCAALAGSVKSDKV